MPRGATTARLRASNPSAQDSSFAKQLRETLNAIPTHAWYATASGTLIFVNELAADYGGLPKDHPLRLGVDTGAPWDSLIAFLHPDDHAETRSIWSHCLTTGRGSEVNFRAVNATLAVREPNRQQSCSWPSTLRILPRSRKSPRSGRRSVKGVATASVPDPKIRNGRLQDRSWP